MAVLPIITAPDKRLKVKSEPVEHVDASTCSTGSDLTFRRLSGAVMMGRTAMGKLSQIC